jgi:hypothetical protein
MSLWVEQARADCSDRQTGLATAETLQLSLLRKERRELPMERALLRTVSPGPPNSLSNGGRATFLGNRATDIHAHRGGEDRLSVPSNDDAAALCRRTPPPDRHLSRRFKRPSDIDITCDFLINIAASQDDQPAQPMSASTTKVVTARRASIDKTGN